MPGSASHPEAPECDLGAAGEASLPAVAPTILLALPCLSAEGEGPHPNTGAGGAGKDRTGKAREGQVLGNGCGCTLALSVLVVCHLKVLARYWAAWFKKGP